MKFPNPIPVKDLAKEYGLQIIGDDQLVAKGINEIHKVENGDITFSDVKKYFKKSLSSDASIIILNEPAECPEGKAILVAEEPFEVYNNLILKYRPLRPLSAAIDLSANIHPSAVIEPGVVIGPSVRIGKYSHIQANAVICEHSVIGDHVVIQYGAVIGSDAFYYKRGTEGHKKWRSGGRVVIEDHVEIGANNTINKGVSGDTIIGEGSKFDCQIHIGHGTTFGKHCIVAAGALVGGKTRIGNNVVIYGQVGIIHNVKIGDHTTLLAGSLVNKDLEGGKTWGGAPVSEFMKHNREIIALKKLPDYFRENKI